MEYDTFETNTIRCLITNAIFHAYRIRWFLEQFWVIMSTGMGCISKYRIQIISNSTEIGTASPKITQQNLYFPLSNLRSPLYALRSTLTYLSFPEWTPRGSEWFAENKNAFSEEDFEKIRRGVGPRESLSPLIKLNTTGRTGRAYRKAGNLKLTNQPSRFATSTTPSLLFINSFPAFISRHKP
jgi:hypothetical protein